VLKGEDMSISVYHKKRHYLANKKPQRVILLEGASAKKNIDEDNKEVFVLFYPHDINRGLLYLRACSDQVSLWVNTINTLGHAISDNAAQ